MGMLAFQECLRFLDFSAMQAVLIGLVGIIDIDKGMTLK
jgi:hypothetical protein